MGFLSDLADGITDPFGIIDEGLRFVDDKLLGGDEEDAAQEAAAIQAASGQNAIGTIQQAGQEAQQFLSPFQQLGQQGLAQSNFLTDPNAQFDFLQNNPLFQLALDNANRQTNVSAAARGRLSSDDTRSQFVNNALLSASPLISNQQNAIQGLLGHGLNVAQGQANIPLNIAGNIADIQTGIGNAEAAGVIGGQTARTQGVQNLIDLGGRIAGAF